MTADRHLTPSGHEALGRLAARSLAADMSRDLFDFDGLDRRRHRRRESRDPAAPRAPLLGGSRLDAEVASAFGVGARGLAWQRDGRSVRILVAVSDEKSSPWQQALAGFGLERAARARRGDDVHLRVVRYLSFDEYGRGRRDALRELGRYVIHAVELESALAELEVAPQRPEANATDLARNRVTGAAPAWPRS